MYLFKKMYNPTILANLGEDCSLMANITALDNQNIFSDFHIVSKDGKYKLPEYIFGNCTQKILTFISPYANIGRDGAVSIAVHDDKIYLVSIKFKNFFDFVDSDYIGGECLYRDIEIISYFFDKKSDAHHISNINLNINNKYLSLSHQFHVFFASDLNKIIVSSTWLSDSFENISFILDVFSGRIVYNEGYVMDIEKLTCKSEGDNKLTSFEHSVAANAIYIKSKSGKVLQYDILSHSIAECNSMTHSKQCNGKKISILCANNIALITINNNDSEQNLYGHLIIDNNPVGVYARIYRALNNTDDSVLYRYVIYPKYIELMILPENLDDQILTYYVPALLK